MANPMSLTKIHWTMKNMKSIKPLKMIVLIHLAPRKPA